MACQGGKEVKSLLCPPVDLEFVPLTTESSEYGEGDGPG